MAYGCATFFDCSLEHVQHVAGRADYSLNRVFIMFVVILVLAALMNIFSSHLLAMLNNISVWWHVSVPPWSC